MASLDVLDYQVGLDAELAKPGPEGAPLLEAPLRKQAIRDARRTIDMMAFRFAVADEWPLPEDLDYLRALEAMKPPAAAAAVLARQRPVYARRRVRRLATTWIVLGVLMLVVAGGWWVATSETADTLALVVESTNTLPGDETHTFAITRNFTVEPEVNRLHLDGTVIVTRDSPGVIEVRLLDPSGQLAYYESFNPRDGNYIRHNVLQPAPGEWQLIVDFLDVQGSARVSVDGVRPAR